MHIESQDFMCIFGRPFSFDPHQNLENSESILAAMDLGMRKVDMQYDGSEAATLLIRTPLPACERTFVFHEDSFLVTLSRTGAKDLVLAWSMWRGRPRYLEFVTPLFRFKS